MCCRRGWPRPRGRGRQPDHWPRGGQGRLLPHNWESGQWRRHSIVVIHNNSHSGDFNCLSRRIFWFLGLFLFLYSLKQKYLKGWKCTYTVFFMFLFSSFSSHYFCTKMRKVLLPMFFLMFPAVLSETLDLDSHFPKVPVVCCPAASNPKIRK